jgi:hypothetical protein
MPLPDQTPKLSKVPFLVGDAVLLGIAWLVASRAPQPMPSETALLVVACGIAAAVVGIIPFLTDYARRQDEALDDRQRGLEALTRTIESSAEQISIAAQGLQEITLLAQKNLQDAGELPRQLQAKIAEIQPRTESGRGSEKARADKDLSAALGAETKRLEAIAEQIARTDAALQKAISTLEKLPTRAAPRPKPEPAAPKPTETAPTAPIPAPAEEKAPEIATLESAALEPAASPEPVGSGGPPDRAPEAATPSPVESPAAPPPEPTLSLEFPPPVAAAKAPRKPRKPKIEAVADLPAPTADPAAETAPSPSEFSQVSPDEASPAPAVSADGATRLLVTAYIGIGNRLFVRGEGPGLSWEKGVPLQFVSIGKWRWETPDATGPIRFKLYKNDELECAALGERTLEAGRQQDVTASF